MKLIAPTLDLNEEATHESIANTIQSLEKRDDPFVILQHNEMTYMQTLWTPEGFSLEYQEESSNQHFQSSYLLPKEQVISCFQAYLSNDQSWKSQVEFEQKIIKDIPFNFGRSIGQFFGGFIRGFNRT